MQVTPRSIVEFVCLVGTASSLGFYALSACGIVSYLRARKKATAHKNQQGALPPLSILKPLKGIDPQILKSFRSYCEQNYPDFELIFGVSDSSDPAIDAVRQLQREYPGRRIELVVCPRELGTNRKLSTLAQMLPAARHEVLVVSDSDILVPSAYLSRVMLPLQNREVGMVTCLYRGIPGNTAGSRLEAIGIGTDFTLGVLSARLIEHGLHFGLGSTMAFRRADLLAVGGFEGMADYLADDYELGSRIASLGKCVELSEVVVDTFLPPYSFREFMDHQLRWMRSVRGSRGAGYVGLALTFGFAWALALFLVSRGGTIWTPALCLAVVAARLSVGLTAAKSVLGDKQAARDVFLLPLRDLLAPVIWAIGLFGNRIVWRGDVFYLQQGRLVRAANAPTRTEELSHLP